MRGKDLLLQLKNLNQHCLKALEEENFRKLWGLMQLKKDLLDLIQKASFEKEDLSLVKEALDCEEELAGLALSKRAAIQARLKHGWLH